MGNKGCGELAEGAHVAGARFLSPPASVHALGSRAPVRSRVLEYPPPGVGYMHPDKVVCARSSSMSWVPLKLAYPALEAALQSHFVVLGFLCWSPPPPHPLSQTRSVWIPWILNSA